MGLLNYARLPFSSGSDWLALQAVPHVGIRTFLLVTLPLSLLPPAMLIYAGERHLPPFTADAVSLPWSVLAGLLLVVEMLSVALMAWLTRWLAAERKITVTWHDAFLLTELTAVPLWLSSTALAVPAAGLMAALLVLGLLLAGATLYHGTASLLGLAVPVEAQALAAEVFAAGALLWVLVVVAFMLQVAQPG